MTDVLAIALFYLVAAIQSTAANELPVTYTVDCLSPSITYQPQPRGESFIYTEDGAVWPPSHSANAWNSSYVDHTWHQSELFRPEWPHYTWATFSDGMDAPSATLSFVGSGVAVVTPDPLYKPKSFGGGVVELALDGVYKGTCSVGSVRCNLTTDFGPHTFTVKVTDGSFTIDHFEVSTGKDE